MRVKCFVAFQPCGIVIRCSHQIVGKGLVVNVIKQFGGNLENLDSSLTLKYKNWQFLKL